MFRRLGLKIRGLRTSERKVRFHISKQETHDSTMDAEISALEHMKEKPKEKKRPTYNDGKA